MRTSATRTRHHWHIALPLLLACLFATPCLWADDDAHWPELGHARFKLWLWSIYDVSLEAPQRDFHFPDSTPYAMTFEYRRDVDAVDILDIVEEQWHAQKVLWPAAWMEQLHKTIPDVLKGDRLRVVVHADGTASVLRNDMPLATISDTALVKAFAGIWLGEHSTYTAMRHQLLGAAR